VRVAVDYGDKKRREVEVYPVVLGNGKLVYRSAYHTNPVTRKLCYVEYDPSQNRITIKEV